MKVDMWNIPSFSHYVLSEVVALQAVHLMFRVWHGMVASSITGRCSAAFGDFWLMVNSCGYETHFLVEHLE